MSRTRTFIGRKRKQNEWNGKTFDAQHTNVKRILPRNEKNQKPNSSKKSQWMLVLCLQKSHKTHLHQRIQMEWKQKSNILEILKIRHI